MSPTTGAINFNVQAHTNLIPGAITGSSGAAGSVLVASTAATSIGQWTTGATAGGTFVASTASIPTWLAIGSSGQCLITASSGVPVWSTGMNFVTSARQLFVQRVGPGSQATALTSANFSLSSGWGSTATISSIVGTDQAYRFTILTGSTMASNPSVTTTFADGLWNTTPSGICGLTGGTGAGINLTVNNSPASSGQILQMFFVPTSGVTYTFTVINMV